jgi:hypothetical protein
VLRTSDVRSFVDHVLGPVRSASELCRAVASLTVLTRRPGLSPIGQVLSLNDDGLDLHPAQWITTWYKGRCLPRTGRSPSTGPPSFRR